VSVALTGLLIETVADLQLRAYQRQGHKGVCSAGLWAYTRHPNYFGDWLFWLAVSLIGCSWSNPITFLGLLSPLMLFLVMTKITAPLTEALSLKKRPELYGEYCEKVPMFFPKLRMMSGNKKAEM
jgi:steroid 5-alpha reductase family enzyme